MRSGELSCWGRLLPERLTLGRARGSRLSSSESEARRGYLLELCAAVAACMLASQRSAIQVLWAGSVCCC